MAAIAPQPPVPALALPWPAERIAELCRKWRVQELAVFGSAVRGDFGPGSDLDLLVRFAPDAEWTLLDHSRMERELEEVFGRRVDLVTRAAIEESPNWVVRREILASARTAYAR
jgi:hypothetical protein